MININESTEHLITDKLSLVKYLSESHDAIIDSYMEDFILTPYIFSRNELYLLKYDDKYAGYYYFMEFNSVPLKDRLILTCGLMKEYRSAGIGTYALKSISDYIFTNYDYKKLGLDIKYYNLAAIKVATKAGYGIDFDLWEIYEHEEYYYVPYVKTRQKTQ